MPPFALTLRGPHDVIFDLSDVLGFEGELRAKAVSVFEEGQSLSLQALYGTEAEAYAALKTLPLDKVGDYGVTELPDEDWVSKSQAGLPPVEAGRFWVYGSHDADHVPETADHPILIDAGMAFGTGHHGTTKGCLLIFDDMLNAGERPGTVLDLGAGAGTLAIAAAKALDRSVMATDIDADAVRVCGENAVLNGVGEKVVCVQADGFQSDALAGKQFDLIFANILAGPLMGLAPDIAAAMVSGGHVILSGILNEQADTVAEVFRREGLEIKAYPAQGEWTSLYGVKP